MKAEKSRRRTILGTLRRRLNRLYGMQKRIDASIDRSSGEYERLTWLLTEAKRTVDKEIISIEQRKDEI